MNRHIAPLAVILSAIVFALPGTRANAQVANPWDPFASQPGTPTKTSKKPRVRKDLPPPAAPVAARNDANQAGAQPEEADSRPFLRSMEGATSVANSPPDSNNQPPSGQPGNRPNARANAAALDTAPASSTSIERTQLAPVIASDGSGLPYELWRGLDLASIEKLLAALEIPPRSQAIHALWTRLIMSRSTISNDPQTDLKFAALRARALYRSGLNDPAGDSIAAQPAGTNPVNSILHAVSQIVMGQKPEDGCRNVRSIDVNAVPASLKPETILVFGYCAAISGNKAATEMTANIAREQGVDDPMALAALDSAAQGTLEKLPAKGKLTGLAYRLLETVNLKPDSDLIKRAEPALLVTLSRDKRLAPAARASAAESAARINAIDAKTLAAIYHEIAAAPHTGAPPPSNSPARPGKIAGSGDPLARARLFDKLENEFTPFKKARLARSFLDNSRRAGLYLPALQMVHATTDALHPVPEISWFAETAIEIALAAKDHERARSWARFSSGLDQRATGKLDHWLALIDIADPDQTTPRGTFLKSVESMALNGRFGSKQLHRLATVLDALDYHVPVALWQAASSTPQPNDGHLPQSGVLTRLQDAAKAKEFGRTVLLAMQALGPNGAEGAHMIALGDSIRALKRAGLESDARRLGFEALFASWPRANSQ